MRKFAGTLTIALAMTASHAAMAQTSTDQAPAGQAPAGSAGYGDIIVTAQKREENLQDVPLAITAVSSEALETKGVNGLNDFRDVPTPGLFVQSFAGANQILVLDMRGVSNSDPGQGTLELGVAVYLDDVYLGRAQGLATELADPERVEVLRGPQGTLFGRNAEGGAIRIVSKKPTGELGGRVKGTIGEYGQRRFEGHLNLPEVAGFAVKLDYINNHLRGYTKNGPGPVDGLAAQLPFGYEDGEGYRASVRWQPLDGLTVDYVYDKADSKAAGDYYVLDPPENPPAGFSPPTGFLNLAFRGPESINERVKQTRSGMFNEPFRTKTHGHTLTAQYELNDALTVKSISAWRGVNSSGSQQLGGAFSVVPFEFIPGIGGPLPAAALSPAPDIGTLGTILNPLTPVYAVTGVVPRAELFQDQFSQEVQLLGSTDTLEWVIGGYYFEEDVVDTRQTFFSGVYTDTATVGGYTDFVPTNPFALPFPGQGKGIQSVDSRSYAAFAQATWSPDFADGRLHITPGLRYTNDKKISTRTQAGGVVLAVPILSEFKESRVDPSISIAYDATPDVNIFARYAQAYRAGGTSVRDPGFAPFGAEVNRSYEFGVKSRLFNGRGFLNVALFYNDITGRQLNVQADPDGDPAVTRVINLVGSTPVMGAEVEFGMQIAEGLSVNASYAFLEADRLDAQVLPVQERNNLISIPNLPQHSGTLSVDYLSPDLGVGKLALHGDYSLASSWQCTTRVPAGNFGHDCKRDVANARVALKDIPLGPAEFFIAGFVKNAFNSAYPVFTAPGAMAVLSPPRRFGLEVGVEF